MFFPEQQHTGTYFWKLISAKIQKTLIFGFFVFIGILSLVILLSINSDGETVVWDGGGADNRASTPENWDGNQVPKSDDHALFNGSGSKYCIWDIPEIYSINISTEYDNRISLDINIDLEYLIIAYPNEVFTNGFDITAFRIEIGALSVFTDASAKLICNASTTITFKGSDSLSHYTEGAGFGRSDGHLLCNGKENDMVTITGSSSHPWTLYKTKIEARYTYFENIGEIFPHINRLDIAHCDFNFNRTQGVLHMIGCPVNPRGFNNLTFRNSMHPSGTVSLANSIFINNAENITFISNAIDLQCVGNADKSGRGQFELIDSVFDVDNVIVGEYRWIVSKNHNRIPGDFKIIGSAIVNLSGVHIEAQPAHNLSLKFDVNDDVEIVSGTLIVNENAFARSIEFRDGAHVQIKGSTLTVKNGSLIGIGNVELGMYAGLILDNVNGRISGLYISPGGHVSLRDTNLEILSGGISNKGIIELSNSNIQLINSTMTGNGIRYRDSESSTLCSHYLTIQVVDQITDLGVPDEIIKITDRRGESIEITSDSSGEATALLVEFIEKMDSTEVMIPYFVIIEDKDYYRNFFIENINLGKSVSLIARLTAFEPTNPPDNFIPPDSYKIENSDYTFHNKYVFPLILVFGWFGIASVIYYKKNQEKIQRWIKTLKIKWKY